MSDLYLQKLTLLTAYGYFLLTEKQSCALGDEASAPAVGGLKMQNPNNNVQEQPEVGPTNDQENAQDRFKREQFENHIVALDFELVNEALLVAAGEAVTKTEAAKEKAGRNKKRAEAAISKTTKAFLSVLLDKKEVANKAANKAAKATNKAAEAAKATNKAAAAADAANKAAEAADAANKAAKAAKTAAEAAKGTAKDRDKTLTAFAMLSPDAKEKCLATLAEASIKKARKDFQRIKDELDALRVNKKISSRDQLVQKEARIEELRKLQPAVEACGAEELRSGCGELVEEIATQLEQSQSPQQWQTKSQVGQAHAFAEWMVVKYPWHPPFAQYGDLLCSSWERRCLKGFDDWEGDIRCSSDRQLVRDMNEFWHVLQASTKWPKLDPSHATGWRAEEESLQRKKELEGYWKEASKKGIGAWIAEADGFPRQLWERTQFADDMVAYWRKTALRGGGVLKGKLAERKKNGDPVEKETIAKLKTLLRDDKNYTPAEVKDELRKASQEETPDFSSAQAKFVDELFFEIFAPETILFVTQNVKRAAGVGREAVDVGNLCQLAFRAQQQHYGITELPEIVVLGLQEQKLWQGISTQGKFRLKSSKQDEEYRSLESMFSLRIYVKTKKQGCRPELKWQTSVSSKGPSPKGGVGVELLDSHKKRFCIGAVQFPIDGSPEDKKQQVEILKKDFKWNLDTTCHRLLLMGDFQLRPADVVGELDDRFFGNVDMDGFRHAWASASRTTGSKTSYANALLTVTLPM